MPFLTEELWGRLPRTAGSVMTAAFPKAADYPNDPAALIEVKALQEAIVEVRRVRSAMGLADRKPALTARCADPALLQRHLGALRDLCGVEAVEQGGPGGVVATIVVQGQEVYLPLDGVIDVDAERARLDGQLQKGDKDIEALERRLSGGFREKAPANVVAEFEAKLAKSLDERERLQKARKMLG
jgi:valyl-tRNA synthetase